MLSLKKISLKLIASEPSLKMFSRNKITRLLTKLQAITVSFSAAFNTTAQAQPTQTPDITVLALPCLGRTLTYYQSITIYCEEVPSDQWQQQFKDLSAKDGAEVEKLCKTSGVNLTPSMLREFTKIQSLEQDYKNHYTSCTDQGFKDARIDIGGELYEALSLDNSLSNQPFDLKSFTHDDFGLATLAPIPEQYKALIDLVNIGSDPEKLDKISSFIGDFESDPKSVTTSILTNSLVAPYKSFADFVVHLQIANNGGVVTLQQQQMLNLIDNQVPSMIDNVINNFLPE